MTEGKRILDALKEAAAGKFASVTIEGQRWIPQPGKTPVPASWWAIGYTDVTTKRFRVRKLVVGRMLARYEKREGETIRKATVFVAPR